MSKPIKVVRRLDTPESRAFWAAAEEAAEVVKTWPDWRRAGINVNQIRPEPLQAARKDG